MLHAGTIHTQHPHAVAAVVLFLGVYPLLCSCNVASYFSSRYELAHARPRTFLLDFLPCRGESTTDEMGTASAGTVPRERRFENPSLPPSLSPSLSLLFLLLLPTLTFHHVRLLKFSYVSNNILFFYSRRCLFLFLYEMHTADSSFFK